MSTHSYFTVKQCDLLKLEMVVSSSVAEAVRTEVERTIGMKWASDGEGDSSESKKGAYEKIIYFITNIVYINVLQSLLLILLRICSRSVRPISTK